MKTTVDAYSRFEAMGAVLSIARFPLPARRHEVAVRAMHVFAERHDARLRALNPGKDLSDDIRITIDPEVDSGRRILVGEPISIGQLFGPGYDLHADAIRLFVYGPGSRASITMEGLAYALLVPPYSLRAPAGRPSSFGPREYEAWETAWLRDVLRAFCSEVLALEDPQRADHLLIHRWPTDWSSYFDAGHDWWGAFYWTIEDARNQWVTVIGASSTD